MMHLLSYAAAVLLLPSSINAIFADEAFQIDYHHALLGIPQEDNTFIHQPQASSKASLVYTLSEKSIFGAVNPKDGSLVWRQQLVSAEGSSGAILRAGNDGDAVATGTDTEVAIWGASDGRLVWSSPIKEKASIRDVRFLELGEDGSASGVRDLLVLYQTESQTMVERRDGNSGDVKWSFADASGDEAHGLGLTGSTVHLLSLHGAMLGGKKIKVAQIDTVTGKKLDQPSISDNDIDSASDVLFVGSGTAAPIVAWTDKSVKNVKVNIFGTKTVVTLPVDKKNEEVVSAKIHAPRSLTALPHFLIQYSSAEGHWAEVYHIDLAKSTITKAYDLPKLAGHGTFSTSTSDANVFFTRVAEGALTVTSSVSHGIIERFVLSELVPGLIGDTYPIFSVSEVIARAGARAAVRAAVMLSSGDWSLLLNGEVAWSRPEALTLAESAVFVEPAQGERLAQELAIEEHASMPKAFTHRFQRHISELKQFPEWLQQQPSKIVNSILGRDSPSSASQKSDKFGFKKLVVVATSNGRLIAIDPSAGGKVAWNRPNPNASAVLSLESRSPGSFVVTSEAGRQPYDIDGKPVSDTTSISQTANGGATISYDLVDDKVVGFPTNDRDSALWTYKPKAGHRILTVISRPSEDPVSSIGVVLGDRRVLYKYLNPNLVLVVSAGEATNVITAALLDSASGNTLYEASHHGVDVTRPIAAAISENWLVYSYTLRSGPITPTRGHILVSVHLMESALPDDRGVLGSLTNFSSIDPIAADSRPHIASQSFQIPEEIASLSVSRTRQGITSRLLLAVLPQSDSIIGIPTSALDPRRPVGRAPTAQEAMEGLTQYQPVLDFNPQWSLNHKRQVVGVRKVVATPAVLESTSLVFAFGLDVFGTRVTPSFSFDVLGKSFNKLQMLATVLALFLGVLFVAPLVKRKQINARWQL